MNKSLEEILEEIFGVKPKISNKNGETVLKLVAESPLGNNEIVYLGNLANNQDVNFFMKRSGTGIGITVTTKAN